MTYIEAVFIGDAITGKFYQTNDYTGQNIYSNEYKAKGVISEDESATALTLISAVGLPKLSYYEGMSLLFASPVTSKGAVSVNVDGLGPKPLNEGVDDIIANDLLKGQVILAIYDGTQFVKHRFAAENPAVQVENPPVPAPVAPLPDGQYNATVKVGVGEQYTNISTAIAGVVKEFGADGGNKKINIQLQNNFIISANKANEIVSIKDQNLGWITITGVSTVNLISDSRDPNRYFFDIFNSTAPIIKFDFNVNGSDDSGTVFRVNRSILKIQSGNITDLNKVTGLITVDQNSTVYIKDTIITGFDSTVNIHGGSTLECTNVKMIQFRSHAIYSRISIINIINCNFSSTINTNRLWESHQDVRINATDSIFKGNRSQVVCLFGCTNAAFTNCKVTLPVSGQNLIAFNGAQVTIDGGDYRAENHATNQGIIAANSETRIRIKNAPKGDAYAYPSDGQIIKI